MNDWLTTSEVYAEIGFVASQLEKWRILCLALGRAIRTKPHSRGYLYWRKDLERIREARDNPPGPRFTDLLGEVYVNRHLAKADPFGFSFQRLMRWHLKGCPFLSVDEIKKLPARQLVVYKNRGFHKVCYFHEKTLATIRCNLDAGKVTSDLHGVGYTRKEVWERLGLSSYWLDVWSGLDGDGIPELAGRRLDTWKEARIAPHGHITRYRVYSGALLQEVVRLRSSGEPSGGVPDYVSDKAAMQRHAKWIKNGDLPTWRERCQWLDGRPLNAHKVPSKWATPGGEGEWRNSVKDLDEIAHRIREARGERKPYTDHATGHTFTPIPLREFLKLSDMVEQTVAYYRTHRHKALGRALDFTKDLRLLQRRNRHKKNYFYAREDGEKIAAWNKVTGQGTLFSAASSAAAGAAPMPSAASNNPQAQFYDPGHRVQIGSFGQEAYRQLKDVVAGARELPLRLNATPTPIVIDGNRVFVEGEETPLGMIGNRLEDALCFLKQVVAQHGNWISASEIAAAEKRESGKDVAGIRWDRIVKSLPRSIRDHIESNRRKGYRVRPARVT